MKIAYISENKMYLYNNGSISELQSERVTHYTDTVREINKNKEWKHVGTGAQFTGTAYEMNENNIPAVRINSVSYGKEGLLYSMCLGDMGGIYRKNIDNTDAAEEHILTKMAASFDDISVKNGKIAFIMEGHIAISDERGNFDEITDGDSIESYPSWSVSDNRILCSTSGIARDENGRCAETSPAEILGINLDTNILEEIYSDSKSDCLRPQNDIYGNLYCIKQPHKVIKKESPLWKDILLFPLRIIKAIIGFLNAFTTIFGGEPLRNSGNKASDVKSKQKSEKELYFEGRLLEAEKNEKENAAKGDANPGIFPVNRVLVRIDDNGVETLIKRGVQDYTILNDGSIICSNGRALIHIKDGKEEFLAKAKLARNICIIE